MPSVKKILKKAIILVAIAVFVFVLFVAVLVVPRIDAKRTLLHVDTTPRPPDPYEDLVPEAQFESDTCGLHTLGAIYRVHGLQPWRENLKERLGIDVPTNPLDGTTTGTLQPDMIRVLAQDGFSASFLDLTNENTATARLVTHLGENKTAAFVIARRENGNMHWVAAKGLINGKIMIGDSLLAEPFPEDPSEFIHNCVLSCILIEPTELPVNIGKFEGAGELLKTAKRHRLIQNRRSEP